jgi:hypothetical protein
MSDLEILTKFLAKFRRYHHPMEDRGLCLAYSNKFGVPTVTANSWEQLLNRMVDNHDPAEVEFVTSRGFVLY